ncbi:MAG: Mov34/MPN/PAD-1 family protein [Bryobacteraceae bacterium]
MIRIDEAPWEAMLEHARQAYPNECCGAMLGWRNGAGEKVVTRALPLENAFGGPKVARYEIRPEDLLAAEKAARAEGLSLIGIYHSHPDCDAYFSETDLKHSCPWYLFVVLSIREGRFDHARCWKPDPELTRAEREPMISPKGEF